MSVDLSTKKIIVNVAGHTIHVIKEIVDRIQNNLRPDEILLEFGYQAYPTTLEDSGYTKIEKIKSNFTNRVAFADHVDCKSEDAIWLPLVVTMNGVDMIEKHVMLDNKETKYDYYSSLTPSRFAELVKQIERYTDLSKKPFINEKEQVYLKNTLMIPLLKHDKSLGTIINCVDDFNYRRSGKPGLNVLEIKSLQTEFHILSKNKSEGESLHYEDFKKATIATIIACRLKSTRLHKKALLKIGSLTSVERCIKSCLEFRNVNHTILATSNLPEDSELENYTYSPEVIFHRGDPEDVIRRYLDIAEKLKVDIIIRVTADNPFVSNLIVEKALEAHFATGADYTVSRKSALGTGTEIINTAALKKIKKYFQTAAYSEYMTWYFQNNSKHFKLNFVDLPNNLISNHRLTLDYPEDLEMFNTLQAYFDNNKIEFDIIKAFEILDNHPEISIINSHISQKYITDSRLIETLNKATKIKNK
jgi:spore coat polysaccharide biosynthesis protein SpsF (cytidylyltransferase family)